MSWQRLVSELTIYRRVFVIAIQDVLSYRIDFALHTLKYALMILMMGVIWSSIAAQSTGTIQESPTQVLQYFVWTAVLYTLSNFHTNYIEDDIRTGILALRLLKPFKPFLYYFSFEAGQVATESMVKSIVMIPLALFIGVQISGSFGAALPPLSSLLLVATYIPVIFTFCFAQFSIISGLGFWIIRASAVRWAFSIVFRLLSGALVPISFFPGVFQNIFQWLPWQHLVFTPVQILQSQISLRNAVQSLAVLLIWTVIAHGIRWALWNTGYRRFESVGI